MQSQKPEQNNLVKMVENCGRQTVAMITTIGYCASLVFESVYWLINGFRIGQPVRFRHIIEQMMQVGIHAIPIVSLLAFAVGMMLAIQGIYTLRIFGAQSQVTYGIAFSVVREFSPLITGILVAGRSGSAFAARIGMMTINQEVDALDVMGINPVRYLVAPALIAMLVMMPCLTFLSDVIGLLGGGIYVALDLDTSLAAYWHSIQAIIRNGDLIHGLSKSILFGLLTVVIGVANGANVKGGAEGVGKATTRAVVQSICAIIVTDMIFAFMVTR